MVRHKKTASSHDRPAARAVELREARIGTEKILGDIREEIALLRFKKLMLENAGKLNFAGFCD